MLKFSLGLRAVFLVLAAVAGASFSSGAAMAAPAVKSELVREINQAAQKLDKSIALLPAKTTRFCRRDTEAEQMLQTLEDINKNINQLDSANPAFESIKKFAQDSKIFSSLSDVRNTVTLKCLKTVIHVQVIPALKDLQALLRDIRKDLDKAWLEARKVEPELAKEFPVGAVAPKAVLAYPIPEPKRGATTCDAADMVCAPEPDLVDRKRAMAIWDSVLTHELTLSRLEHAPSDYDEAMGLWHKIPGQVVWHFFFSAVDAPGSEFRTELKAAEDLIAEVKLDFKYTAHESLETLQTKLEGYEKSSAAAAGHLFKAAKIWADHTGNRIENGESLKTGATYVAVGSGIFLAAAGAGIAAGAAAGAGAVTTASGAVVVGTTETTVVATGATAAEGWAFSARGTVALYGVVIGSQWVKKEKPAESLGSATGLAAPTAKKPEDAEFEVELTPNPAKTEAAPSTDPNGSWDIHSKPEAEKKPEPATVAPEKKPEVEKPKPPKPPKAPKKPKDPAQPKPPKPEVTTPPVASTAGTGHGTAPVVTPPVPTTVPPTSPTKDPKLDSRYLIGVSDEDEAHYDILRNLAPNVTREDPFGQVPQIIEGQVGSHCVRVSKLYSDYPAAIFLCRAGVRAVRISNGISANPGGFCAEDILADELKGALSDIKKLKEVDVSPELRVLEKDLQEIQKIPCKKFLLTALKPGSKLFPKINEDACSYLNFMEKERLGSTLGFPYRLVECPR